MSAQQEEVIRSLSGPSEKDGQDGKDGKDGKDEKIGTGDIEINSENNEANNDDDPYQDIEDEPEIEEVLINLKFLPLESLSDSEYSKLSVAHKKMAKNMDAIMQNLDILKSALFTIGTGHNRLVRNVKLNTELVDDVDNEVGHYVGQMVDMQNALSSMQNENLAIKNELHKKDIAMDILEKEVKKRNLIISGLVEELNENLFMKVVNILHPICNRIAKQDIDCVYRVGTPQAGKTREVVVELFSKFAKEDLLRWRRKLRENPRTRNIWINEDLPTRTRKTKGLMRDIVRKASEKGIPCAINGDHLICNNKSYNMHQLKALPKGLKPEDMKTRTEGNRIGFMSEESYLSNFFPCQVTVDGYTFPSAEHAIQYKRSLACKSEDVALDIKRTLLASDVKQLGEKIPHSSEWDKCKLGIVRCIVKQKFVENNNLKIKLLNTKGFTLEEATFDQYWGTGIPVYSKDFKAGRYSGKNIMGRILEEIRDEFLYRSPSKQTPNRDGIKSRKGKVASPNKASNTYADMVTANTTTNTATAATADTTTTTALQTAGQDENREDAASSSSLYIAGISESVLKCMLMGLKNSNTGFDVQQQIIMRLGQISEN